MDLVYLYGSSCWGGLSRTLESDKIGKGLRVIPNGSQAGSVAKQASGEFAKDVRVEIDTCILKKATAHSLCTPLRQGKQQRNDPIYSSMN